MITAKRSSIKALSIGLGLLFTGWIFYNMHYNIPWDWEAPGTGRLPQEIVAGFLEQAYDAGNGATAVEQYFSPKIADTAIQAQERENGGPVAHEIRSVVAQGLNVVVFQRIAAARGEPATDAIDVFATKNGRIVGRERYLTSFGQ